MLLYYLQSVGSLLPNLYLQLICDSVTIEETEKGVDE